ncbi:MAG TPA: FAD/NAD(P)-binding oxidoreductase [Bryobacteraceae bacterium]|nr:FAD/NAD(P)-binding oxidoreductase [Bryobacteraceae bacterium]
MAHYKYLIVGGGMTADAAVRGISELDALGSIGIVSEDVHPPYNRPPLTKGLWKGDDPDSIWRGTESKGVELHLGRTVRAIDVKNKSITDDLGTVHSYDKLLLATGGSPRRLPFNGTTPIVYFRTLEDYRAVRGMTELNHRFAVIGGGFIGSEIAAGLAMNGRKVTMIFPDDGIGARMYPADLSQFITGYYREKGVEVLTREQVTGMQPLGHTLGIELKSGRAVEVEGVVAGIGITPNTELAEAAGLKVSNGIVVDEYLRANNPDIFAAGDVANFFNPALAKRIRVEHEDNANTMGTAAGRAMAGERRPYDHLPFFYSDLFDLGFEAIGDLDSRLETVAEWKEQFREGVIYYLQAGLIRGVLLWNIFGQVDAARKLIGAPASARLAA